jgi:hypothetical protein
MKKLPVLLLAAIVVFVALAALGKLSPLYLAVVSIGLGSDSASWLNAVGSLASALILGAIFWQGQKSGKQEEERENRRFLSTM